MQRPWGRSMCRVFEGQQEAGVELTRAKWEEMWSERKGGTRSCETSQVIMNL